jgi:hypothetical protein
MSIWSLASKLWSVDCNWFVLLLLLSLVLCVCFFNYSDDFGFWLLLSFELFSVTLKLFAWLHCIQKGRSNFIF